MSEDLADRIEALDVVEVTQADREAAADVWRDYIARIGEVMAEKAIRKGISDDTIIVQAFARHRITALRLAETSAALPDDVAKLKKQLQDEYSLNGGQGAYAWRSRELCGKAAAALTAQAQRIAELEKTLRWIFRNGLKHSSNRPDFVNKAFSDAFAAERAALKGGRDD